MIKNISNGQCHFHIYCRNDWLSSTYKEYDYGNLTDDYTAELELIDYVKTEMDRHWEPLSREMGLKSDSTYLGKENPLIAMCDNVENLVATGFIKLSAINTLPLIIY